MFCGNAVEQKDLKSRCFLKGGQNEMTEKTDNSGKHGYWIHKQVEDQHSVSGYFVLPECKCGLCGFVVSYERDRCPHCRAIMDGERRFSKN